MSAGRTPDVLLLSLPWTTLTEPNLGLAILKARLAEEGVPCRVRHLNLGLLQFVRPVTYYSIANIFSLNDFMFSGVLEPDISPRQHRLLFEKAEQMLTFGTFDRQSVGGAEGLADRLIELRNRTIPDWLGREAEAIARTGATMVGFSCMFDQTIASAALARLVKDRAPDKLVALGGYAVRSPVAEMLLGAFPWIDAVCAGEGEQVIGALARASAGEPIEAVRGIHHRSAGGEILSTPPAAPVDLDRVPVPDFDDFYADVAALAEHHRVEVDVTSLPVENSRGCWWGAKHHCVFCGIHDEDLRFRAKKPERVLEQLESLRARHRIDAFRFSDYILPHRYYDSLLPALARAGRPFRLTSEIKANVGSARFAALAAAGFEEVQPGIESFSTPVLESMRKGVKAVQNVETLLLGRRHGIIVHYNLLYGFPDDEVSDYQAMVELIPLLRHLDAPSTRLPVQVTRYAPLQTSPGEFGLTATGHEASYQLIFSEEFRRTTGFDLDRFCYYFERPFENAPKLNRLYRRIEELVDSWIDARRERDVLLQYRRGGDGLLVVDTRGEAPAVHRLDAEEAETLLACERPVTERELTESLGGAARTDRLLALGLLVELDGRFLSLALPAPEDGPRASAASAPAWADPVPA